MSPAFQASRNGTIFEFKSELHKKLVAGEKNAFFNRLQKEIKTLQIVQDTRKTGHANRIALAGDIIAVQAVYKLFENIAKHADSILKENNKPGKITKYDWFAMDNASKDAFKEAKADANMPRTMKKLAEVVAEKAATRAVEKVIKSQTVVPSAQQAFEQNAPAGAQPAQPHNKKAKAKVPFINAAYEPRNINQALSYTAIQDENIHVVIMAGDAGGGKTYTALRAASEAVNDGLYDQIKLFRPRTVTAKNDFGAVGGGVKAKMAPYIGALQDTILKMTGKPLEHFEKQKIIDANTPDFDRGGTHDKILTIIDEAQNLTRAQTKMLVTRIGEGARFILTGDISGDQNDLGNEHSGLAHFISYIGDNMKLDPVLRQGMAFIRFTEADAAARNPFLPHLLKAEKNLSAEYQAIMEEISSNRRDGKLRAALKKAAEYAERTLEREALDTAQRFEAKAKADFPSLFQPVGGNVVKLPARQIS